MPQYLTTPNGPTNEGGLRKFIRTNVFTPDNIPLMWGVGFFLGSITFIRSAGDLLVCIPS